MSFLSLSFRCIIPWAGHCPVVLCCLSTSPVKPHWNRTSTHGLTALLQRSAVLKIRCCLYASYNTMCVCISLKVAYSKHWFSFKAFQAHVLQCGVSTIFFKKLKPLFRKDAFIWFLNDHVALKTRVMDAENCRNKPFYHV